VVRAAHHRTSRFSPRFARAETVVLSKPESLQLKIGSIAKCLIEQSV
jgi:hypothetical protein